eukprot:3455868-Ditylum_brightwellii.AAC.1
MVLSLSNDNLNVTKWWIDGAFGVHHDMQGHTGITMSLGKGLLASWSMKQCLNTTSSMEMELVGVNDAMSHVLWITYFLEAQGYKIRTAKVYQINLSAMLLEKNGKWSSGKCSKHINVRYFL